MACTFSPFQHGNAHDHTNCRAAPTRYLYMRYLLAPFLRRTVLCKTKRAHTRRLQSTSWRTDTILSLRLDSAGSCLTSCRLHHSGIMCNSGHHCTRKGSRNICVHKNCNTAFQSHLLLLVNCKCRSSSMSYSAQLRQQDKQNILPFQCSA
jgi:hypothetical protein